MLIFFFTIFWLSTDLGPIKEWELELDNNILKVNQSNNMTRRDGIYGIGDVCSYPGKLKLILTGFSRLQCLSSLLQKNISRKNTAF